MRFHPQGPQIPSTLLHARDEGRVVFLCGAGVSESKARLPNFRELAKKVINDLGIEPGSKARRLLDATYFPPHDDPDFGPQLDQVFDQLESEVARELIHEKIAEGLKVTNNTDHSCHSTILRLSRGNRNQPQLITTNFDHLFEQAEPTLKIHIPPSLPSLRNFEDLEGIVYLHGRLTKETAKTSQNIIVSGADFGRAYLAEMWATKFLIEVLQHHHLVFVGYSANDPVMRYLLQGIRTSINHTPHPIYAFLEASDHEQILRLKDRGVIPLTFLDKTFSALWETLDRWADRADDLESWTNKTLKLAQRNPYTLQPFERGQVLEIVTTKNGATAFSAANPSASWITILDGNLRHLAGGEIDDDLPVSDSSSFPTNPRNFLSWVSSEEKVVKISNGIEDPPSQLFSLSGWISNQITDPVMIWWLAQQLFLSPPLLRNIKIEVEKLDLGPTAEILSLLIEKWERSDEIFLGYEWRTFANCIVKHGWMPSSLSQFNRTAIPHLVIQAKNIGTALNAHSKCLEGQQVHASDLLSIEVEYPPLESNIKIPDSALFEVLTLLTSHLQTATRYLNWIGIPKFYSESLLNTEVTYTPHIHCKQTAYLRFIIKIFTQLHSHNSKQASIIAEAWDPCDEHLQSHLCLYSLSYPNLFPPDEAFEILHKIPDSIFWDTSHRPEKLHGIKACWSSLTENQRSQIEIRILNGPPKYEDDDSEYQKRVARYAAIELGWLKQKGIELTLETEKLLTSLHKVDSFWQAEWIDSADQTVPKAIRGFITKDENHTSLLGLEESKIIETASKISGKRSGFEEKDPFRGLVKENPQKAFSALVHSSKRGEWPMFFWQTLLNIFPDDAPANLAFEISEAIVESPLDLFGGIVRGWTDWLLKQVQQLYNTDKDRTLKIWDDTLRRLGELPEKLFTSGLGEPWIGGKNLSFSRRTYDHAINSPAGRIVECLQALIEAARSTNERRLPSFVKPTIAKLFKLPPIAVDYVVSEITIRLNFYFRVDRKWTAEIILPCFDRESPLHEAAWSGFFHQGVIPDTELFKLLKFQFFEFVSEYLDLQWEERTKAQISSFVVCSLAESQEVFSDDEGRLILQDVDENARITAIQWMTEQLEKSPEHWDEFGRHFFKNIWPMQRQYQTEGTSSALVSLISHTGSFFQEAVEQLKYLLVPSDDLLRLTHKFGEEGMSFRNPEALKYPILFVDLLDRVVSDKGPAYSYGLSAALDKLAELNLDLKHSPQWKRLKKLS